MGVQKKLQSSRQMGVKGGASSRNIISGDRQLIWVLRYVRGTAVWRITTAGAKEAAKVGAKAMKAEVPSKYKNAKRGIGWRALRKKESPDGGAKVGAKVGRTAKRAKQEEASLKKKGGRSGKKGVGISGANIHWIIGGVGTKALKPKPERETGERGGPKRRTGSVAPDMDSAEKILSRVSGLMFSKFKEGARARLTKEISKGKAI